MISYDFNFTTDLNDNSGAVRKTLEAPLYYGDIQAHTIRVTVNRNGVPADLTGLTPMGYLVHEETGETRLISEDGEAQIDTEASIVSLTLNEHVYENTGRVCIILQLTDAASTTTILALYAWVSHGITDTIVTEETSRMSLAQIEALIDRLSEIDIDDLDVAGTVKYDEAQTLDDAEKLTALQNVSAEASEMLRLMPNYTSCYVRVEYGVDVNGVSYNLQVDGLNDDGSVKFRSASSDTACYFGECRPGDVFYFQGRTGGSAAPGVAFFGDPIEDPRDSTKRVLEVLTYPAGKYSSTDSLLKIVAPPKAKYIAMYKGNAVGYGESNLIYKAPLSETVSDNVVLEESLSARNLVISAEANCRYVCTASYVSTLSFTPCASGLCEVIFKSGTTATTLDTTVLSNVKWPDGFLPSSLSKNTWYDIMILNGTFGQVMTWA